MAENKIEIKTVGLLAFVVFIGGITVAFSNLQKSSLQNTHLM